MSCRPLLPCLWDLIDSTYTDASHERHCLIVCCCRCNADTGKRPSADHRSDIRWFLWIQIHIFCIYAGLYTYSQKTIGNLVLVSTEGGLSCVFGNGGGQVLNHKCHPEPLLREKGRGRNELECEKIHFTQTCNSALPKGLRKEERTD